MLQRPYPRIPSDRADLRAGRIEKTVYIRQNPFDIGLGCVSPQESLSKVCPNVSECVKNVQCFIRIASLSSLFGRPKRVRVCLNVPKVSRF